MIQRSGLANIIYVKNFVSCDKTEEKGEVETLDRSENCTCQKDVPAENNEDKNNTGTDIRPVHSKAQSDSKTGTGWIVNTFLDNFFKVIFPILYWCLITK